jgi:hypothetical protein
LIRDPKVRFDSQSLVDLINNQKKPSNVRAVRVVEGHQVKADVSSNQNVQPAAAEANNVRQQANVKNQKPNEQKINQPSQEVVVETRKVKRSKNKCNIC